jgi:hypothetical protein
MSERIMNQSEFEAIIKDATKTIIGDISWSEDEDHSPALEFRIEIQSETGYPIFIKGSYNTLVETLSFSLIHRGSGRIYGLDLGKDHHNPACTYVGEKHKHSWNESLRDKQAYVPDDINAEVIDPVSIWEQFCREAKIRHEGVPHSPGTLQIIKEGE